MAGIRYKGQIFSGAASFGDADHVAYDNTESGLTATDVQGAVDELSNAEGVSYDNTESGLEATDVQGALDEVVDTINNSKPMFRQQIVSLTNDMTTNIINTPVPTMDGYTPIGIGGYAAVGSYAAGTNLFHLCMDNGKVYAGWNPALTNASAGVNVYLMYVKNSIIA